MGKKSLTTPTSADGSASKEMFVAMNLERLRPNPWNTKSPTRYSGKRFDEFVSSVRSKGVIQPILVRPVEPDGTVDHEIVCGERRYKASLVVANDNGGPSKNTIPTIVRHLSDDDAFALTIVENLQREDLDPLEEAESFKAFLDKNGVDAAGDLAERVGVSVSYVRSRVAVLDLPRPALKAWRRGQMTYGHLEQLKRLKDKKQIARFVAEIVSRAASEDDDYRQAVTVKELKHDIDMESPSLKETIFDQDQAGCLRCYSNSSVQKKLFEEDEVEGLKCLNPRCYKQHVNNHLLANWESEFKSLYGTNGFRFQSGLSWTDFNVIHAPKARAACKKCDKLVTLVGQDGSPFYKRACLGEKECYQKTYYPKRGASGSSEDAAETKAATRAKNHGIEFRELFYQDALPQRFGEQDPRDQKVLHGTLLAFYDASDYETGHWILKRIGIDTEDGRYWDKKSLRHEKIFAMSTEEVEAILHELTSHVLMTKSSPETRREVANHIGIDLSKEWAITEPYLKKKTIAELLAIGEKLKIFKDVQVLNYTTSAFGHANFAKLKKGELVKVFLESGIELTGKVPEEILA